MSDKKSVVIDRLQKLINSSGKSREEIANAIECDTSTITKHYNGNRQVAPEFIIKYAQFFGVSADYLLGLSDVESTDRDIQFISKYTGLSEKAICVLHCFNGSHIPQITSSLLETETCMLPEYMFDNSELELLKKENDNVYCDIDFKNADKLKNSERLCFLTSLNDYFKISKKENHGLLSINPKGKLVDLSGTDIEAIKNNLENFDVDDMFSIMTISQYDIVEKVLLDRIITYIKTLKCEVSDNGNDTKA